MAAGSRRGHGRPLAAVFCLVAAAVALLAWPGTVRAHASFLRSDPPAGARLDVAPARVQVWFTEPLEAGFSEVQVLDAARRRVDLGDSRVLAEERASMAVSLPPLEPGVYTVAWRALSSVDGHVTRGVFSLSVGVEGPPVEARDAEWAGAVPFEATVRWIGYLAAAGLVGGLVFQGLVLRPAARRVGLGGVAGPAAQAEIRGGLWWSWAALLIASLWALALQFAQVASEDSAPALRAALGQLVFGTRYGAIWLARLGLVAGLGLALWRLAGSRGWWAGWAAAGLGAGVLLTNSLYSHSAALADGTALAVAADWLHQLAVAAWVGGLFVLALALPGALAPLEPPRRWQLLVELVSRFSRLALASVAVLAATGLYQAMLHVGSLEALPATAYGWSLVAKLALVAPLLLLGAINLLVIGPGLRWRDRERDALARRFGWIVRGEATLAALVLLASGVLTSLPPARQVYQQAVAARPLTLAADARDLRLELTIAPPRPGVSTFSVRVRDARGQPVEDAERVDLRFTYLDQALGESVEPARPRGQGRYEATGSFMTVQGRWQIELLVRRPGRDDVGAAFRVALEASSAREERPSVGGAQAAEIPPLAASGGPALAVPTLVALGLALLGLGLLAYVGRGLGFGSLDGRMLALASLAVVGLGMFLLVRGQVGSGAAAGTVRNPFPPTQESLDEGRRVYGAYCLVCHGEQGRGDGPGAAVLNPRPADLRQHMAAGHTDAELFAWVSEGVAGTAMVGFKDQLTEAERWHVINYIRSLAGS